MSEENKKLAARLASAVMVWLWEKTSGRIMSYLEGYESLRAELERELERGEQPEAIEKLAKMEAEGTISLEKLKDSLRR